MLDQKVNTIMLRDSKSFFDTITKLSIIFEKRLSMNTAAIRENYTTSDLLNVVHVSSSNNIANTFTKAKTDETMLLSLMETGKLSNPISQWILVKDDS